MSAFRPHTISLQNTKVSCKSPPLISRDVQKGSRDGHLSHLTASVSMALIESKKISVELVTIKTIMQTFGIILVGLYSFKVVIHTVRRGFGLPGGVSNIGIKSQLTHGET